MSAMIQNDDEKEWMLPLLEIRNALDVRDAEGRRSDFDLRDFRRMDGRLHLFHARSGDEEQRESLVHGPYKQSAREEWLRMVLGAQVQVRDSGPEEVSEIELISDDELVEIRRIWIKEKHEFEDRLPVIYEEVTGETYPGNTVDDDMALNSDCVEILRDLCGEDEEHFRMVREMLSIERQERSKLRRNGILDRLERSLVTGGFENQDDALEWALDRRKTLSTDRPAEGEQQVLDPTLA